MILLAEDFRQTLPVIPRSTPVDALDACLTFDRTKSVGVPSVYIKMDINEWAEIEKYAFKSVPDADIYEI